MKRDNSWLLVVVCVVFSVLVGSVFGRFVLSPVRVEGESMEGTYHENDLEWCYHFGSIDRGDVVVCSVEGKQLIKRVIGMPGDTIKVDDSGVYINDKLYEESYLKDGESFFGGELSEGITLGSDEYVVLGDNRWVSRDSRSFGKINGNQIVGVVL